MIASYEIIQNTTTTKFSGLEMMNELLPKNNGLENPRISNNKNRKPTYYDSIKKEKLQHSNLLKRKQLLQSFMMKLNNLAKFHLALKVKKLNLHLKVAANDSKLYSNSESLF